MKKSLHLVANARRQTYGFTAALAVLALTVIGFFSNASAQTTLYWNSTAGTVFEGTGTWDTTSENWSSDEAGTVGATWSAGDAAVFTSTNYQLATSFDITVSGTQTASSIDVNAYPVELDGGTIVVTSGSVEVDNSVPSVAENSLTIDSTLAGSSGLTITGTNGGGTVILNGATNFTGGNTTISSGTLDVESASAALPGTLNLNGGSLVLGSSNAAVSETMSGLTVSTTVPNSTISGQGSLTVSGGSIVIGGSSSTVTLDMSGLSNFVFNSSTGSFLVGLNVTTSGVSTTGTATLNLATNSTITAATLGVGYSPENGSDGNGDIAGTLNLGTGNTTINAATIIVGDRSGVTSAIGTIQFLSSGTLTLDGAGGAGTRANITVGETQGSSYSGATGVVDLSQGTTNAMVGTLTIGDYTSSSNQQTRTTQGTFTMGSGTLNAQSIILAQATANQGTTSATSTILGTFNLDGGTVLTSTLTLGNRTTTSGYSAYTPITATFNLNSGTLEATTITTSYVGTAPTSILNWNSGTIANYDNGTTPTNLTISGSNLQILLSSTGTNTFAAESGHTITVNAALSDAAGGGGNLVVSGSGTVVLNGTNTYTGTTTVNAGTLLINANESAVTGATIVNGGTLGGTGTLVSAVTVNSGGAIAPGAAAGTAGTLTLGNLTISGGAALDYVLSATNTTIGGGVNSLISSNGTVTISGTNALSLSFSAVPVSGTYTLLETTGSLADSGTFTLSGLSQYGGNLAGEVVADGDVLLLEISGSAGSLNLVWSGTNGNTWDVATTTNWNNSGSPSIFHQFDNVTFDDTASTGAVTISGTVTPGSVTFANNSLNYTLSGSGSIGGSTSLVKTGSASLTINNVNSFTGGVYLDGGTVVVSTLAGTGTASALGSGSTIEFNGGTLEYTGTTAASMNQTITLDGAGTISVDTASLTESGVIADGTNGAQELVVSGSGTLVLSGSNTYSGGTIINSGTLSVANNSALGTGAATFNNSAVLEAGTSVTLANGIAFNGNNTINAFGNTLTLTGVVSGTGNVVLSNSGTVILSNLASTFTGGVNVEAGTLQLGNSVSSSDTFAFTGNALSITGGTLNLSTNSPGTITVGYNFANLTAPINVTNGAIVFAQTNDTYQNFNGALALSGSNTISMSLSQFGIHSATFNDAITGSGTLTFTTNGGTEAAATFTIAGSNNNYTGNVVLGSTTYPATINLNQTLGAASWTFTSGSWTVNLSGTTHTFTDLNSSVGGTISGTTNTVLNVGSGNGNDTYSGVLKNLALVKQGTGSLTLSGVNTYTGNTTVSAGGFTLASTGALAFALANSGSSNQLTIATGATANLNGTFNINATNVTDSTDTWTLVSNSNGSNNVGLAGLSLITASGTTGFTNAGSGIWTDTVNGSVYTYTESTGVLTLAVPEPSTIALTLIFGAGMLLLFRRVRRQA